MPIPLHARKGRAHPARELPGASRQRKRQGHIFGIPASCYPTLRHPSGRTAIGGARRRETSITKPTRPTSQIKAPRLQSEEGTRPGPQRPRHPHVSGPCARAPPDGSIRRSSSIISPVQMGTLRHGSVCTPPGVSELLRGSGASKVTSQRGNRGPPRTSGFRPKLP